MSAGQQTTRRLIAGRSAARTARAAVGLAVVLVMGVARGAPDPPEAWTTVPDPLLGCPLEGAEGPALSHGAYRIVDERGVAVAGARVWGVGCGSHGDGGLLDPAQALVSDARGWVRVPEPPTWGELIVGADGFAGYHEGGPPEEGDDIVLLHGRDLEFEVRDALDRPVPDALVGYRVYCGHTPDLRQARAGADGRGTLPAVLGARRPEGWLWPLAAGSAAEDVEVMDWCTGRVVFRLEPGRVLEGSVVDATGKPAAGAYVGQDGWNRGPWAVTDAAGRFRLLGLADGELQIDAEDGAFDTPQSVHATLPPPGTPLLVRLGSVGAAAAPVRHRIDVRVFDAAGQPVASARVAAWSPEHGWGDASITGWHAVKPGDPHVLHLPAGPYELEADGWLSGCGVARASLQVSGDATVELRVETLPTWRVDASALEQDQRVLLCTARRQRDVTDDARRGRVRAPLGEQALLRVCGGDPIWSSCVTVALPLVPPDASASPVSLRTPPRLRVRLRTVDVAGAPVPCSVVRAESWEEEGARVAQNSSGELWMDLERTGLREPLLIRPSDPRLANVAHSLDIPQDAGATFEPAPILVPTRAVSALTVAWPAGLDPEDLLLELVETGHERNWQPDLEALAEGEVALPAGAALRATLRGHAPALVPLTSPGPWRIAWPQGSLLVEVLDGTEPLARFCLLVDGFAVSGVTGRAQLKGLAAGVHELVVCASGRSTRRTEVTLAEGQHRSLTVTLDALPAK